MQQGIARARIVFAGGLVATALGCGAQMLNRPSSSNTYGPTRRTDGGEVGIVRYYTDGAPQVVEGRKQDAYKQMYQACSGLYEIVAEGPSQEGATAVAMDIPNMPLPTTAATVAPMNVWTIRFRCIEESAEAAGAASYEYPTDGKGQALVDGRPCPRDTVVATVDSGEAGAEAEACVFPDRTPPVLHGPYVGWWSDNGRAQVSGWYYQGKRDGDWIAYDHDGLAVQRTRWSRGRVISREPVARGSGP